MTPTGGMKPRQWELIQTAFHAALEVDASQRGRVLAEHCGSNLELRSEVETLLASAKGADQFLGSIANRAGVLFRSDATAPSLVGRRFGAYRLLRLVGQGGMGVVYLAERDDHQFEKQVAVKLLPLGLGGEASRERFLAERRILAGLEHPGITRLLDAGIAEDGTPFFVMEYVEGEPIDLYCAQRNIGVDDCIRLFLHVCDAVEHAHRNLVVHRDLKPGNVLVGPDGSVKLLDFGIAKALDSGPPGDATALTQVAGRPLTPAYASPEQVRGEPVTTATDVYALGMLLYELLSGHSPYTVRGLSPAELERIVCTHEPLAPSVVADRGGPSERLAGEASLPAAKRGRCLRGDLDTIVLKAIRKEPHHRYRSVADLADDLRRHLAGMPVTAQPPRLTYRAGKFARRRPGVIAALTAGLLVAGTFVVMLLGHADRMQRERAVAEAERDRARVAAATAEEVRDFLIDSFDLADPARTRGLGATARDILDAGAERALGAPSGIPEVQADMLTALAEVYLRLNVTSQARPLVEAALAVREEHGDTTSPGFLENRWQLLRMPLNQPQRERGYAELVEMGRDIYGEEHPRFAALLAGHAKSMMDLDAAAVTFDRSIAILRRHPDDVRAQLATTLLESSERGNPPHGVERTLEALAIRRSLYGSEHPAVGRALSNLALRYEPIDPVAADSLMRQAVEIHRRTAGEAHTTTLTLMNNLAGVLRDQGRYQEAEPWYREVLRLRRIHQPEEIFPIVYAEYGLGRVLLETGRPREAEPLLRSVAAAFPVSDERGRLGREHLAQALVELRRFDEAEGTLRDLLEGSRMMSTTDSERLVLESLANLYTGWGQGALSDSERARLSALTEEAVLP
jgi:eukaryotic-like serine/threonine-protein kinase